MTRFELVRVAGLAAAVLLSFAGVAGAAPHQEANCGDPIEPGQVACPDLALSRSNAPPVEEDGELVLVVRVENVGNAPSAATRVVAISPGWDEAGADVPGLPPRPSRASSTEVAIRLQIPDDARGKLGVFTLVVDPDQVIEEHGSDNNRLLVRAAISQGEAPVPDLRVSEPSHEFVDASRVAITTTVANIGREESPATTLAVSGSGWEQRAESVEPLGPDGAMRVRVELSIPESARGATTALTLSVTPVPGEPDTANNSIAYDLAVPARPRLVPDLRLVVTGHELVSGGDRLELSANVENIGDGDAPPTRLVATAPGWQEASVAVPGLVAGDSADVTISLVVPEEQRGQQTTFALEVEPVPDEAGTDDNRASRTVVVPDAEPDEGGVNWRVIAILGALAIALLSAAALWWSARLRTGRGAGLEPAESAGPPLPPEAPPPERGREIGAPTPQRVVNTGFAARSSPAAPLDPAVTLACGASYLFWLDVGPPVAASAERTPVDIPWHQLPPSPELTVAIFSLSDGDTGFALEADADTGSLVVGVGDTVEVGRQPGPDTDPIALTRLLFPVRAPLVEADAQLRCSIYCRGSLVQSRLVTARVRRVPSREDDPGFESVLDYTLAPSLDPLHLSELPEPTLTVMLNESSGTHDFTFYGADGFKSQSSFDVLELQDLITGARAGLRRAAWGDEEEWREGRAYLYLVPDPDRLRRDLVELAKRGFRFYASIADRLAGEGDAFGLSDRLVRPGSIQIASVESPRHLLPAALLYDYIGFDSTQRSEDYVLCPRFVRALSSGEDLEGVECFTGDCPSRGEATVVCPSGFWGYRHRLGLPVSVAGAPDAPVTIVYHGPGPSIVLAASTDFDLLEAHVAAVTQLCPRLQTATTRADTLRLMKTAGVHVFYFYCHGGVQERVPFLKVGTPEERGITSDLLFSEQIRWMPPQPLVFINGCRTTALEPEIAIELVSSLVRISHASGVIGTEITVFEPLARDFAEAYLRRFLDGKTVGEAVRGARLALLARGNPLGLAYIPFALEGLRLVADA